MTSLLAEELITRATASLGRSQARTAEVDARQAAANPAYNPNVSIPKWVTELETFPAALRAEQREGRLRDKGHWGFVAYRCACYGEGGEERWGRFKARLEEWWAEEWRNVDAAAGTDVSARVGDQFEIMWVEDRGLEGSGVEEVRTRFRELREGIEGLRGGTGVDEGGTPPWERDDAIPAFWNRTVCLCVDEGCLASVLGNQGESSQPQASQETTATATATASVAAEGQTAPCLLAVDADYDPEGDYDGLARDYKGVLTVDPRAVLVDLATTLVKGNVFLDQLYSETKMKKFGRTGIWSG